MGCGYLSSKLAGIDVVASESTKTRYERDDPKVMKRVFSASILVKNDTHNHTADAHLLRRNLSLHVAAEAMRLQEKGSVPFPDIVRYLEDKYETRIPDKSLRLQMRWKIRQHCPRDREAMKLIERLHSMNKMDHRMNLTTLSLE